MKKLLAALLAIGLVSLGVSPANAEDAYNPDLVSSPNGIATFLIGEDGANIHFSTLISGDRYGSQWVCKSVADPDCSPSKAQFIGGDSILKVCKEETDKNCVVSLELAGEDGVFHSASYIRNTLGMKFPANAATGFMGATTPSLWSVPEVPSASGTTEYAVIVRANNQLDWSIGKFQTSGIVASVLPYRTAEGNYESPRQFNTSSNHRGEPGIGIEGHGYECAWVETGNCGVLQDFAANTRVRLTVRITSEVGGWFKGRIKNPLISVARNFPGMNDITVEAAPAEVARTVYQTQITKLTSKEREFAMDGLAGSLEEGFLHWERAGDLRAFRYLNHIRDKVEDKSTGTNTFWNFTSSIQESANPCLNDTSRVLGIVTTNAMVYDGGIPKFKDGFLDYQVAGLHYQPDGTSKVLGSYDLVMRSEVAHCLYGFSKAPLSATISIVGGGSKTVATTVVSEKRGWLKLAAYGFTFSRKTIRVKVRKARPTTITCISSVDPAETIKVRALKPKCPTGYFRGQS